jgi:hypothetical protein
MPTVTQVVKKYPAFYGSKRFLAVDIKALDWIIS